jgi:hypothetical protein
MFSAKRFFLGMVLYMAYLIAISLVARQNLPLYLVLMAAGSLVFLLGMFSGVLTTPGYVRRVRAHGIEATAIVLDISDTGMTINKNPRVKLRLQVNPIGQPPYEAELAVVVSRIAIPRVGDMIRVKYDPDRPRDMIVI